MGLSTLDDKLGLNVFSHLDIARTFISDAERTENSMTTRIEAAIHAAFALDPVVAKENPDIGMYTNIKYLRPLRDIELMFYYNNALQLAKFLLSKLESN